MLIAVVIGALLVAPHLALARPPSAAAKEIVALCNAGYALTLDGELSLDMAEIAEGRARGGMRLSKTIQGMFLAQAKVSEERAVELYRSYVSCVQSQRSIAELVVILRQRHDVVAKQLLEDGMKSEAREFEGLYERYIAQVQENQKIAAHETGRDIQILLLNAASVVQRTTGSEQQYLFSKTGSAPKDRAKLQVLDSKTPTSNEKVCERRALTVRDGEFTFILETPCPDELDRLIEQSLCKSSDGPEVTSCTR